MRILIACAVHLSYPSHPLTLSLSTFFHSTLLSTGCGVCRHACVRVWVRMLAASCGFYINCFIWCININSTAKYCVNMRFVLISFSYFIGHVDCSLHDHPPVHFAIMLARWHHTLPLMFFRFAIIYSLRFWCVCCFFFVGASEFGTHKKQPQRTHSQSFISTQ